MRRFRIGARPGALRVPLAAALLLALSSPAFADTVQNSVVSNGGVKTVSVLTGGTATVDYYIQANGGDGQNGCNASDGTPVTLSVVAPAAVGVSPGSLVFTACHQGNNTNEQTITFTAPSTAGSYAVGVTTADNGAGTYNTAQGGFTLVVTAPRPTDTTAPTLSLPAATTVEATGPAGAAVTYTATASDNVDGTRPVACAPASGTTFAVGTTTVACSSTDAAGNTATGSFPVTVADTRSPVIAGVPAAARVEATGPDGAAFTWPTPAAADVVDGNRPVACSPAAATVFPLGITTVGCTAADTRGNTATASFTVTVVDTTVPTLVLPAQVTAEAVGPDGAPVEFPATATDAVSGNRPVACSPTSGSTFAVGATTVDCTAADAAGNATTGTFVVNVGDTTAPTVALPIGVTVEAAGPSGAEATWTASATDAVDGNLPVACSPASGTTFAVGDTTVGCSATDAHGNTAGGSFPVSVVDTTAPTMSLPAHLTLEATGPAGAAATWTVSALDTVDGAVAVTCDRNPGTFPLGTTTVACTATDAHGNRATGSFTVTTVDTTAPQISGVPAGPQAEATGPDGAPVTWTAPTGADLVDGTVAVDCTPAAGSTFALGTTPVSCTATDARGNTAAAGFDVTVVDTSAPALSLPANLTLEATGPDGAATTWAPPTAVDLVDGPVTVDCDLDAGATAPLGRTVVTCTARDGRGNLVADTFTVTVVDTTAPTLVVPAVVLAEATGPDGARVEFAATATDLVSGPVAVECTPGSGTTLPLGTSTIVCGAGDEAGNHVSAEFQATVGDTTKPTLTLPTSITREATGPAGATATWTAAAVDLVDGNLPVACTPSAGSTFGLGITTVTCTAADTRANGATGTFTVTVEDTTAPALQLPGDLTLEATGPGGAVAAWTAPSATDIVDGPVAVVCDHAPGTFGLGTTTVRCTATDTRGNRASGTFAVKVRDTTAPALLGMPADRTLEATGPAGAATSWTAPSAGDLVDGTVAVACDHAPGTFPLGSTVVTCATVDAAGNRASAGFTVTVVDTTAPVLSLPAPIVLTGGVDGQAVTYTATAADVVDGNRPVACSTPSGSIVLGATTVTCTASDTRGNTATGTFAISVTYGFSGFLAPADSKATGMKAGSTAPIKFRLTDGGGGSIRDPRAIDSVGSGVIACGASGEAAPLGDYATGGTSLRYDTAAEQWIYNWQSPKKVGCFAVRFTLHDGSVHQVSFVTR